ncbi:MAG: hypothetical protein HZB53_12260 [Chloroflexi bacterium]|nr:hypothetical protein [Chloroflexota bacterium]
MDDFIVGPERSLRIDQFLIVSAIMIVSLVIDGLLAAVEPSSGHRLTKANGESSSQTQKRMIPVSHLLTALTDRWPRFAGHLLLGIGFALQILLVDYLARYAAFMFLLKSRGGPLGPTDTEIFEPVLRFLVNICIFVTLLAIYVWDTVLVWQFGPFRRITSVAIAVLSRAVFLGIVMWLHSFTYLDGMSLSSRQLVSGAALGVLAVISFVLPRIVSGTRRTARNA